MASVAIVGKPNSGKSLLFNRLTGLNQKVTNFPGITVEVKKGKTEKFTVCDFPGIYTFQGLTQDEIVSVRKFIDQLEKGEISKVVCVLDATKLTSSLRVGLEFLHKASEKSIPVIFAMNMMDEIKKNKLDVRCQDLGKALGCEVIPVSAKTGEGFEELSQALQKDLKSPVKKIDYDFYNRALQLSKDYGPDTEILFLKQSRLDKILLSPVLGIFFFVAIMLILFQAIFTWSVPFMDLIEWFIAEISRGTSHLLKPGIFKDFLNDAILGGIGSFLVFIPQIFFLTFIVSFLEDSGYLARAAMICHRPLKFFGLSGKSFIALLTGHACAIPAIYAARAVESPRRRFMTILAVPLMSCSARLPVYALLVAAFIPATTLLGGLVGLQGLVFFGLYLFGAVTALLVTFFLSRTSIQKSEDSPFLLELPPYRIPHWRPLMARSLQSAWQFVSKAGVVIFTVTLVVWVLGYFPNGSGQMETSWLASLGKVFEPILSPLDLDWKYGVAILASFVAREVFVGTLGTMFGIEGADENIGSLIENIQNSGLSFASGMSLLIFYVIALQCASTLAVMRRELGSIKVPTLVFVGYSLLAYIFAWFTFLTFS